jgi:hypothetical protein
VTIKIYLKFEVDTLGKKEKRSYKKEQKKNTPKQNKQNLSLKF